MSIVYVVKRKTHRSKFHVVWKVIREHFDNHKFHDMEVEIVSADLSWDDANAFARRLNEQESAKLV